MISLLKEWSPPCVSINGSVSKILYLCPQIRPSTEVSEVMHYICTHAAYYAASTASVSLSFGEGLSADIRRHFLGHQGFQNVHVVIRYPGRNAAKILSKSHFFRRISNDKQTTQLIQNL